MPRDVAISRAPPNAWRCVGSGATPPARQTSTKLLSDGARCGCGSGAAVVADEQEPVAAVRELAGGRLADIVLDAIGSSQALRASIEVDAVY